MTGQAHERTVSRLPEITGGSPEAHGIRPEGLSVVPATSMEGRPIHRIAHLSLPHGESVDGRIMPEKVLRELRDGTITVALPAGIGEQTSVMPEAAFESYGADHRQAPELGADGRVRLAGGVLGEALTDDFDERSASGASTLPPPYSLHRADKVRVCSHFFSSIIS